jgi:cyanophycin synthetase
LSITIALPFEDSRRLTGANLFFASTGAVLEVAANVADELLLDEWRGRVAQARDVLGWNRAAAVVRLHPPGASLALAAPCDQLFVATEVNEWALCSALFERDPDHWSGLQEALQQEALANADDPGTVIPPVLEEAAAFARFEQLAAAERRPRLQSLIDVAMSRDLPYVLDDDLLTLGAGTGAVELSLSGLPDVDQVRWEALHEIPTAIVTGSNGKTTTVRLLAACARAHGWRTAYSSTDGVFLDDQVIETGDYSGPAGARLAMRDRRAQAAILETARGGILRRGLAVSQAQVALVTNISSDHFGEYGIYNLEGLADVKLTVAAVLPPDGLLVLNADDPVLRAKADGLAQRFGRCPPIGWFALDADAVLLRGHRARGGFTCGVRNGRLYVSHGGAAHDLGSIGSMPLTVDGSAVYNIGNLAGAALGAVALGIPPAVVASVFATFGANPSDNVGRMMRFDVDGVRVVLDYAHNAAGLRGLLSVAEHLRHGVGRLGLLLGHAGNRRDAEIEELARVAAEFHPDLVVVKENEGHLRGRGQGEVPRVIRAALLRAGMPESALPLRMTEVDAARCALEWARPGDVVALLVHSSAARAAVLAMLEQHTTLG